MTTEQECYERELASLSSVFTGFDRVTMYEEANTWYKIAKLHFDHGWHHQSMSCYFKAGNCYSKAIEAYDQVLKLDPDLTEVYQHLGQTYESQGEYAKAIEAYSEVIKCNPNDIYAHVQLGSLYRRENNFYQAEVYLYKALELDPDCVNVRVCCDAYCNLGMSSKTKGDYYEAIQFYKKALKIKRDYQPAITMLYYITRDKAEHLPSKVLQDAWEI